LNFSNINKPNIRDNNNINTLYASNKSIDIRRLIESRILSQILTRYSLFFLQLLNKSNSKKNTSEQNILFLLQRINSLLERLPSSLFSLVLALIFYRSISFLFLSFRPIENFVLFIPALTVFLVGLPSSPDGDWLQQLRPPYFWPSGIIL
jgi:hypothetical protein